MITYIEKCQIKHLHKEDPEYWTVDKLAESFPASPAIIKVSKSYEIRRARYYDNARSV